LKASKRAAASRRGNGRLVNVTPEPFKLCIYNERFFGAEPVFMVPDSAPSTATLAPNPIAEGLRGITVSESKISFVDGTNGRLLFRGYDIPDLAQNSTFEETSYLLIHGELPTKPQLREFQKALGKERKLPSSLMRILRNLPKEANPMDALRTGISYLGAIDPEADSADPQVRMRVIQRIIAKTPTIVAAFHRARSGLDFVQPRQSGGQAENFLRMLLGREPDEFEIKAMDVALVLHADHEFNASTFAARVTISTLSDVYSAVTSAIGTLKGPLHGGANRAVMAQLKEIGDVKNVDAWVARKLASHEKIMGFGHAVYKTMDPRATVLKEYNRQMAERKGERRWYEISAKMQDVVYNKKQLWPNVDFYSAGLYEVMGIPDDLFTTLFAVSRMSGWLAHIVEQLEHNKLIRPVSQYAGAPLRPWIPPGKRK
jgi:citrate synthase